MNCQERSCERQATIGTALTLFPGDQPVTYGLELCDEHRAQLIVGVDELASSKYADGWLDAMETWEEMAS